MSRRACFYADEICARGLTDGRTDVRTEYSLSLPLFPPPPFASTSLVLSSLVNPSPPPLSLLLFSLFSPARHAPRLLFPRQFDTPFLTSSLSLFLSLVLLLLPCLCISSIGPPPPPPAADNSTCYLVLLSRCSIPYRLFSGFCVKLFSAAFYCLFLRRPVALLSISRILLTWHTVLVSPPVSFLLCRRIVCGGMLLPSLLLRPILPLTFLRYSRREREGEAAPVFVFCS